MLQGIGDVISLNNGTEMPQLGFGTFKIPDGRQVMQSVRHALDAGYRSIDTASYYQNERGVGTAILESGIPREELFITTKVWVSEQGYDGTIDALNKSLKRLGLSYVDLYLVHWPRKAMMESTWKAMEKAHWEGLARSIGVSNFLVHHLQELKETSEVDPVIDQVELHPYLVNWGLLEYCNDNDIRLEAWAPLMQGNVGQVDEIASIAKKHEKSPAQVVLRWDIQHGFATIPKSVHKERILENKDIFDFELDNGDMHRLDTLGVVKRFGPDPNYIYDYEWR